MDRRLAGGEWSRSIQDAQHIYELWFVTHILLIASSVGSTRAMSLISGTELVSRRLVFGADLIVALVLAAGIVGYRALVPGSRWSEVLRATVSVFVGGGLVALTILAPETLVLGVFPGDLYGYSGAQFPMVAQVVLAATVIAAFLLIRFVGAGVALWNDTHSSRPQ